MAVVLHESSSVSDLSTVNDDDSTYQMEGNIFTNESAYLKDIEQQQEASRRDTDSASKRRSLLRVQQALIAAQEVGDEKVQIVQQIQDLIENKARQLDLDYRNLDFGKDQENTEPNRENHHGVSSVVGGGSSNTSGGERQSKRARRTRTETPSGLDTSTAADLIATPEPATTRGSSSNAANASTNSTANHKKSTSTSKKKKRKSRQSQQQQQQQQQQQREESPPHEDELAIDPDEPTYCLCDQISYGEMILCDNDLCPIEWFHFSCVALATKPKGKWFCPKCRGDRPNVMKPKAQFLKELERYNKEKEEKA
ncbi:inhibitor of growth protein 1 isoform X2 [Anabrus simplex]|uniref:inhibitor of growth protein 1 isoform X2 n=1 Tax=Anabrus simplex TaxID=316456 RepID=UPI0034DDB35D